LVDSLRLFRSAYVRFSEIAWTPKLFKFGSQITPHQVIRDAVGYKLTDPIRGRVKKHISEYIGEDYTKSPQF